MCSNDIIGVATKRNWRARGISRGGVGECASCLRRECPHSRGSTHRRRLASCSASLPSFPSVQVLFAPGRTSLDIPSTSVSSWKLNNSPSVTSRASAWANSGCMEQSFVGTEVNEVNEEIQKSFTAALGGVQGTETICTQTQSTMVRARIGQGVWLASSPEPGSRIPQRRLARNRMFVGPSPRGSRKPRVVEVVTE
jgi:hypothetical protein